MNTRNDNGQGDAVTHPLANSTENECIGTPVTGSPAASITLPVGPHVEVLFWAIMHRRRELQGQLERELIEQQLDNYLDTEDELIALDDLLADLFTQLNQQLQTQNPNRKHSDFARAEDKAKRLARLYGLFRKAS